MEDRIVISLGGSLIVPEEIDTDFLREFKNLIESQIAKGKKFVITVGGGKICRKYQEVAKELAQPSADDLDWIGIKSLNLNAELVRVIFEGEKNVEIYGAEKPGNSTDFVAINLAIKNGAQKVVNLSNIDYVYDSDPKTNPNAKKFEKISWSEYRNLIPKEWNPGLNSPFDPVASELAEKEGITVVIMNGKPVSNLKNFLEEGEFKGTIIS